jgi:hypothetical protein
MQGVFWFCSMPWPPSALFSDRQCDCRVGQGSVRSRSVNSHIQRTDKQSSYPNIMLTRTTTDYFRKFLFFMWIPNISRAVCAEGGSLKNKFLHE